MKIINLYIDVREFHSGGIKKRKQNSVHQNKIEPAEVNILPSGMNTGSQGLLSQSDRETAIKISLHI